MKKRILYKTIAALLTALTVFSFMGNNTLAAGAGGAIATGIDVSKYNGNINWGQVAASGVSFTFVRVGNPQTGLDPQFGNNMRNANAAGIKTGVYYYSHATTVEAATLEAMQTLQWISGYTVNFPVVIDVEASGQKALSPAQMQAIVNTFCSIIDAAGYYPIVYTNKSFYQSKLGGIGWDKWIAQYGSSCDVANPSFWQCSNKGRIPGIAGNVDLNYQFKNYDSLIISDGFVPHNGSMRYYANWKMQTGWVNLGGLRFHFDPLGNMQTGWFTDADGKIYYLTPGDGHAAIGVQKVDNVNYLFDINGVRCSGLTNIGDASFYCDPITGALQTGWIIAADGNTYYADQTGVLAKGVYILKDVIYYFDSKGALVRNGSFTLDGMKFVTTADGIVIPAA